MITKTVKFDSLRFSENKRKRLKIGYLVGDVLAGKMV